MGQVRRPQQHPLDGPGRTVSPLAGAHTAQPGTGDDKSSNEVR